MTSMMTMDDDHLGHSNSCMLTDAVVLDLELMSRVEVCSEEMTAVVEGGAYLRQLDQTIKGLHLGTPVGTFPLTGAGGLILGGGRGWLTRLHGFSVDNLLEMEVVLASGKVVVANDRNDYADLIEGCRGGGGNFGVVTKFKLQLHRLPSKVFGGYKTYLAPTHASMVEVGKRFDHLMQKCPPQTSAAIVFGAPYTVTTMWAHFGEEEYPEDVSVLREASYLGGWMMVENSIREMSYHDEIQEMTRQHNQSGFLYNTLVQLGSITEPLPDSFFEELVTFTKQSKHRSLGRTEVALFIVGRDYDAEIPSDRTSIDQTSRNCRYFAIVDSYWHGSHGELGKQAASVWARECSSILSRYSASRTMHAPHAGEEEKMPSLENDELLQRLRSIKLKYDPRNFFRQNYNVDPNL